MRWQKTARLAIASFILVFAGVVFFTMRQRAATPADTPDITREDEKATSETKGLNYEKSENGKLLFRMKAGRLLDYSNKRQRIAEVELTLPDKNGRNIVVKADRGEVTGVPGEIDTVTFTTNVRLTTSDGVEIRTDTADYNNTSGMVTVPGPVEFTRGRMKGKGVGATYDKNRDVLWVLARVQIDVAPDAKGQGAAEATSETAGLARADNYLKLTRNARVVSEARIITADDLTAIMKPDGETIERVELRGNAHITESGANARNMAANNIDLQYAADGRTLQSARLMENSSADLPAAPGQAGSRISGRTIDMAMGPDGTTVTALNANQDVQVDLPPAGEAPAKQIRANTLQATGSGDQGLDNATFAGGVEYREMAPARGNQAALDRTARSLRLMIVTKPGLGEIEKADFRGNFKFVDGRVTVEAPRGLYFVNGDRIEISPSNGDPGPTPMVNDGQLLVEARNIQISPGSRQLTAETNVRSTIQSKRRSPASGARGIAPVTQPGHDETRMPLMLKQDRPTYIAADRLTYDGKAEATYTGNARLWQDQSQSKIDAQTIILNDKTGNLTARTNVSTTMLLEEVDSTTKQKKLSETRATSDVLVYDDTKRLAVYTGTPALRANMKGPYGDVTSNRIDLYLKESGDELERAEAHGSVVVKESGRTGTGDVLVYTAADDMYVLTGNPVEVIEQDAPNSCKKTIGTTLTFQRSVGSIRADTNRLVPLKVERVPCPAERRN
jgi:LPS export ABC transporter protein LptC